MSFRCKTRRSSRSAILTNRDTREKLFNTAGPAPRRATPTIPAPSISQIAQLRAQKAKLLGYPNYAAYKL